MIIPRSDHIILLIICLKMFISALTDGLQIDHISNNTGLKLEPLEAIVYAGENVTFTCYYPYNVSFTWNFDNVLRGNHKITKGVIRDKFGGKNFWSELFIPSVTRTMSGEIECSVEDNGDSMEAFLIVNGVQIGGSCRIESDCVTDKATCQSGFCSCPQDEVLLKFTKTGYEICRKMIYKLYDPCEFTEQCFHLVDSKSECSENKQCVCAPWTQDVDGRCIPRSELAHNKNQELYRIGLVAITCLIIVIVALSLWITMKRSCQIETLDTQMHSITHSDGQASDEMSVEITEDKPPSYDDLESHDTITAPPNFKEALTSGVTSKKFLRQSSAPAGQLLCTAIVNHRPS